MALEHSARTYQTFWQALHFARLKKKSAAAEVNFQSTKSTPGYPRLSSGYRSNAKARECDKGLDGRGGLQLKNHLSFLKATQGNAWQAPGSTC
jgi:hypothetical protein